MSTAYEKIQANLPELPGVYRFYNTQSKIIYIGKAKNLKKRVASYFTKTHPLGKTRNMVALINHIEFTVVPTEKDALLLENTLIKEYQPRYNILLKDDKSYPYLCIKNERFPRVMMLRNPVKDGSEYIGPFASIRQLKQLLELIKASFPLRTCSYNLSEQNIAQKKYKRCLEYHLGNCLAPCEDLQSEADYMTNIARVRSILKGNLNETISELKTEMQAAAQDFRYEHAENIKQKILLLEQYQAKSVVANPNLGALDIIAHAQNNDTSYFSYVKVVEGAVVNNGFLEIKSRMDETPAEILAFAIYEFRSRYASNATEIIVPFETDLLDAQLSVHVPQRGDKKKLLDLAVKNLLLYRRQKMLKAQPQHNAPNLRKMETLDQLKQDLRMPQLPLHIECFDNSNFQGTNPVASMVVFKNGQAAKKDYRHFNIKTVEGPNDFASMHEVVFRRYKRLLEEKEPLPQLVLIDGGKGQLNAALEALQELNISSQLSVAGIAKRLEEIYVPNDPIPLYINKKSSSLRLLQQIRNEAHRFAITFHRHQRKRSTLQTELTQIDGIGKVSAQKLLKTFKSIENIKNADEQALAKVLNARQISALKTYFSEKEKKQH
ncbi:MAG: excinuclease ABC subunit UvrC [Chitinophagales bacterium]|nr:excinuclease ABC subunit C [Bacteroidota bacterium]MCB9043662.1 excinuclease ABC subunit C [Chitinophagales bacterium]